MGFAGLMGRGACCWVAEEADLDVSLEYSLSLKLELVLVDL